MLKLKVKKIVSCSYLMSFSLPLYILYASDPADDFVTLCLYKGEMTPTNNLFAAVSV